MSDIAAVVSAINQDLPTLARDVIRRHLDLQDPATAAFLAAPDDREQHQTDWHQWGIISHTRVFLEHFRTSVPRYLRDWGIWAGVDAILRQEIDGIERWELLQLSILLHDIGKFAARRKGRACFHFSGHERMSGEIIRQEMDLVDMGLTAAQAEYVALTAEDHFVLGEVRRRARDRGNYDLAWIDGPQFAELTEEIVRHHPDDRVEIGVLFLGDSLSKSSPPEGPERALGQYDLNLETARRYLSLVLLKPGGSAETTGREASIEHHD